MNLLEKYGKKKVLYAGLASVVALGGLGIGVYAYSRMGNDGFQFANDEKVIVEYGKQYETTCKAYLEDGKELEGCTVSVDGKNEKEKDYLAVGEYNLTLTWEDKELSKKLEVKDTTKPTFEDFKKEITIQEGTKDVNLADYFKAKDLSDVKVEVEGKVDFNKAGKYDIKVKAIDKYNNISEEKSCVVIVATEEEIKDGKEVSNPVTKTENGKQVNVSKAESQGSQASSSKEETSSPSNNSNSGSSSQGSSSSNSGSVAPAPTPTPQPQPEPTPAPQPDPTPAPPVCTVPDETTSALYNNSGMTFSSQQEASTWARQQIEDETSPWGQNPYSYTPFTQGCTSDGTPIWSIYFRLLQQ